MIGSPFKYSAKFSIFSIRRSAKSMFWEETWLYGLVRGFEGSI
jgi:hypothetical protein